MNRQTPPSQAALDAGWQPWMRSTDPRTIAAALRTARSNIKRLSDRQQQTLAIHFQPVPDRYRKEAS
ncbi:hypothetical protein [Naumannella halotolerans]|uniref:Uncharacterized protein n=1 Tax=Naumannella halotolerans TaxID=993414 RepID=A0A4R7J2A4_9ACTN|nr:hypothetical protein [Naumannella halotolerans]TDT31135.1 hypothetical protein CLV29_2548 [Naumannella halotolerans]